jgi:tetratricopeptide (TPR) repeat protein
MRFCLAIVFSLLPLVSLQSQTVSTSKQALDTPEVAEAKKLAAEVVDLYKQGKLKEALPLAKRCLQLREKAFTLADDPLRTALFNLAELYISLQKYDDAEPLLERLVKSYEEFTPGDIRLAGVLQSLGTARFLTGQHDKTEKLFQRALQITEKAYAPDSQKVAGSLSYLAEYYQAVGDFKKALPLYRRMFEITEKHNPTGDSEEFRHARDRYTCMLHKVGQDDRAQELGKRPPLKDADKIPAAGWVVNGKAISLPKPLYPDEARASRVAGEVVVQVVIDESGKVIRACAVHGPPLLMRASEVAAYHAVFSPTRLNGQPVKVTGVVTYNFVAR